VECHRAWSEADQKSRGIEHGSRRVIRKEQGRNGKVTQGEEVGRRGVVGEGRRPEPE
jgi:hypothetical protein